MLSIAFIVSCLQRPVLPSAKGGEFSRSTGAASIMLLAAGSRRRCQVGPLVLPGRAVAPMGRAIHIGALHATRGMPMRTVLIASLALASIGGAVLAETSAPVPPGPVPPTLAQAAARPPAAAPIKAGKRVRNGRGRRTVVAQRPDTARRQTAAAEALSSCLAMWEPATHMTKRQWERACRRVADRLKDTAVR
jgi:hypothetical protein